MLLLEPLGRQRDVLPEHSLTKGAAQLLLVMTAQRSGSGSSVELDELFASWAEKRVISSNESARCTVPGGYGGGVAHGTGPSRAKSTLTVAGSRLNIRIP